MNKIFRISVPLVFAILFISILFWLVGASSQVQASEITDSKLWKGKELAKKPTRIQISLLVTTLDDELNSDGDCSLREAIEAANENMFVDLCGSGGPITDTVTFNVAGTITVTSQLSVTSGGPLVIEGGDVITINGRRATRILCGGNPEGILTLQNLAIQDGYDITDSGGLYNNGGSVASQHVAGLETARIMEEVQGLLVITTLEH